MIPIGYKLAGKYEITSLIGEGGMGIVYEAWDSALRRRVAAKVLAAHLASDPSFVKRFQREAASAANLHHSNIVVIHDVGSEQPPGTGKPIHYMVMQYLDGVSLDRWLEDMDHHLTLDETDPIVRQVADALQYAHDRGIVHRDVKPSNIMLGKDGHVTLMDFGLVQAADLSQLTQSGTAMGTPTYMAPEQITGGVIDRRADVYALGVVVYQMLAGEAPFVRTTPVATAHAHVYETPPSLREKRPDLPGSVEAVVAKALAKTPAHRYAETRILAADLAVASTGQIPAGLAATSEPTVPMGHMPGAAQTPAQTDPASEALQQPPPDPDQTVVADAQAPMMSWSAVPVARYEVPPATWPSRPPTAPENEGPSPERLVWGGAGLAVVVALILFVGGLANGSLGAAIAGVFIGVAGVTAAAIAMREIQRRQREARPTTTGLHCVLCGHELRNSVDPCPSCGQRQL